MDILDIVIAILWSLGIVTLLILMCVSEYVDLGDE